MLTTATHTSEFFPQIEPHDGRATVQPIGGPSSARQLSLEKARNSQDTEDKGHQTLTTVPTMRHEQVAVEACHDDTNTCQVCIEPRQEVADSRRGGTDSHQVGADVAEEATSAHQVGAETLHGILRREISHRPSSRTNVTQNGSSVTTNAQCADKRVIEETRSSARKRVRRPDSIEDTPRRRTVRLDDCESALVRAFKMFEDIEDLDEQCEGRFLAKASAVLLECTKMCASRRALIGFQGIIREKQMRDKVFEEAHALCEKHRKFFGV